MLILRFAPQLAALCLFSGTALWPHSQPTAASLGNLPLTFVSQGSQFSARGQGYLIGLDSGAATIETFSKKAGDKERLLSIGFSGGKNVAAAPGRKLSGVVNYITGNDPQKWRIGLPTVDRVTYPGVYPGIDVVYYGNQQQLEFDLVVKPGADPRAIRMKIRGGGKVSIDRDGALVVGGVEGLRIALPKIYQEASGVRKNIAGHFSIRGTDEVAFRVDAWDRTRPLVIDPAIVYSRLLTGGIGNSEGTGIAVDTSGNVLVTGYTTAADFPRTNSAANAGGTDGFISKLNSDGTALIYSTVFGGLQSDTPAGIAVDSSGGAWVTGSTLSPDFPVIGSGQSDYGGGFALRVDNAGVPVFSTFVGYPSYSTTPNSIAVDPAGNSYVTGSVLSGFPTTPGVVQPSIQGMHAFVSKYSPSGQVLYATLLGGSSPDFSSGQDYGYGIAADSNGDAYITGVTSSPSFFGAPAGGAQTTNHGNNDAFVAKLNPDGSALLYFTFLGGSGSDQGNAITVDASLNAYVTGQTNSVDLPVSNAAQAAPGGFFDAFVAKLNPSGNAFSYVTLLGGSRRDYAKAIAADPSGNVYVTGSTESADFPLVSPVQETIAGNTTSLFSSADGGATWMAADTRIPGKVFDISMNPAGISALAITESGIYRTTDGGSTWMRQFSAPSGVTAVSRSLAAPSVIYAVCGVAVCRSVDDGVTWASVAAPGSSGQIVADPLSAGSVYIQSSSTWWKSTDSGSSWSLLTIPGNGMVTAMIGAPDGALYAVVKDSRTQYPDLYKSTNQGGRWSPLNLGLPFNSSFSTHQLSAAGNAVYFASYRIYQTTNGGRKFTSTMGPESIYEVEVSPKDPSIQYAFGASGYVLKSVDGGATWSATSLHLSLAGLFSVALSTSHIVVDPADPSHVFAISPVNTAVFAAKLNSAGNSFTWSTVLGGSNSEAGLGIATDGAGNAFITGIGTSFLPTTAPPLSGTSANTSAFITKLSDASGDCAPLLNASDQTITGGSQMLNFSVAAASGCNWTASSDAGWAAITSGASTTGAALVTIQVAQNDGVNTRTATLKAGSSAVKITQAGNSCSYSLDTPPSPYPSDSPEYTVPHGGGTVTAVLTATDGCPWTVVNPYPEAITVTSGSSGTGSGTIQLTVAPSTVANLPVGFYLPVGTARINVLQLYTSAQDQVITFSPIPDQTLDFDPPLLAATASSNFPVTFTSNTMTVCQVSGYTVTLIATGTCSISANQAGNVLWFPAPPVTRTFAVTAGPAVPQPVGIVNAANSNATPSTVAIGSYVAIYGHALAGHGDTSATTLPLPTSLNGTQITLGGLPMPLLYAASGQVNSLVPMGLTPNQSYPLVITRDGIPSPSVSLKVASVQPAIYSVNATGNGAGVVTNSLTGQLITQDNPAAAGDYLTIYCNGLGSVHGPNGEAAPKDGAAAPLDLIYSTDATVTANLSTTAPGVFSGPVPVRFSGLTPTLAGLYQVNIQLPYLGDIYGSVTESLTIKMQAGSNVQSNAVYIYVH